MMACFVASEERDRRKVEEAAKRGLESSFQGGLALKTLPDLRVTHLGKRLDEAPAHVIG